MSTKFAEGITSKPLVQCNARRVLDGYKIRINDSSNRESFLINGRDTVYLLIAFRVFFFRRLVGLQPGKERSLLQMLYNKQLNVLKKKSYWYRVFCVISVVLLCCF